MERVVRKSQSFRQVDRWDVLQNISLSAQQRIRIAHALRRRAYPAKGEGRASMASRIIKAAKAPVFPRIFVLPGSFAAIGYMQFQNRSRGIAHVEKP